MKLTQFIFTVSLAFLFTGCIIDVPVVETLPGTTDTCATTSPQMLADPDFDFNDGSWSEGNGAGTVIAVASGIGMVSTTGANIAHMNGFNSYTDDISQFISVPAGNIGGLDFYGDLYVISSETTTTSTFDDLFIDIYSNGSYSETLGAYSNLDKGAFWFSINDWTTIDYSSSTVELVINTSSDSTNITDFYLDTLELYCL